MSYNFVTNTETPHLGGNVKEGDPATFSPEAWDYLIDRFATRSVLDLGSGLGHAANYFHRKGMQVVAVDGMIENVSEAIFPTVLVDLTKGSVECRVDLVHCQEVVEHIHPDYLDNVLASLACGKFVAMSHAGPGQPGYNHINCQDDNYWIAHMARYNFHLLDIDTQRLRAYANLDNAHHLARSGLVFAAG